MESSLAPLLRRPLLVVALLAIAGAALVLFLQQQSAPEPDPLAEQLDFFEPEADIAPQAPTVQPTPEPLIVYVSGAVVAPGVYQMDAGARIGEAIARAGGPLPQADLVQLNLAAYVQDAEHIHVLAVGELPAVPAAAAADPAEPGLLNINTATAAELEALPGIGPATAAKILEHRAAHGPFSSLDGLADVPGLGPATVQKFRHLVTVDG